MSSQSIASFISHGGNNGGVFNEMKQKFGLTILTDFNFAKRGPDHIPIFHCSAAIVLKHSGRDFEIKEEAEGQSKKTSKDNCLGLINQRIWKIVQPTTSPFSSPQPQTTFPSPQPRTTFPSPQPRTTFPSPFPNPSPPIQVSLDTNQPSPILQDFTIHQPSPLLQDFTIHQPSPLLQDFTIHPVTPANKYTSPGIYFTPPQNEGRLGAGGFSKVFCVVKQGEEDKLLALKVPRFEDHDEYRQKFERELQLHTRAQGNEFVAKIIGTAYVQRRRGLVMEYCARGSLADLIRQQTVSPSLVCRIHREIALAIKYLHGEGQQEIKRITHNDLKPDNVLLTDDFRARLCDFGGSNMATQTFLRSSTDRYIVDNIAYTTYFMSPERDQKPDVMPTKVSDIFSLGVCLYASLTPVAYEREVRFYKRFKAHKREMTRPIRDRLYELEHNKVREPSGDNKAEAEILYELLQLIHYCCIQKSNERPNIEDVYSRIELCYRDNDVGKHALKVEQHLSKVYKQKNHFKYDKSTWVGIDQLQL